MSLEIIEQPRYPEVSVKNRVLWVNPNLYLPFKLEMGENAGIGMFVVNPETVTESKFRLGVDPFHGRSAYLGRMKIADSQGNIYQDIDLKGMGYVEGEDEDQFLRVLPVSIKDRESTYGLWRIEKAQREITITEDLAARGVRVYRVGALVELEEIALPNGTKISIEEAKSRGMMNQDEHPIVGLRAYRYRQRVQHSETRRVQIVHEAKTRAEEELGLKLGWQEFLLWYSQTLGRNVAAIHNAGYWHGALNHHNVTLGSEIADFGFDYGLRDPSSSKRLSDLEPNDRDEVLKDDFDLAFSCMGKVVGAVQWDLNKRDELTEGVNFGKAFEQTYVDTRDDHTNPVREFENRYKEEYRLERPAPREQEPHLSGFRKKLAAWLHR